MSSALGRRWKAELERDRARTSATPTFSEVRPALSSEALADMEDDSLDNSDEAQQNQNQTLDVKYLSGLVSGSDAEDEAESDDEEEFANEPEAEEQEAAREGLPESVSIDAGRHTVEGASESLATPSARVHAGGTAESEAAATFDLSGMSPFIFGKNVGYGTAAATKHEEEALWQEAAAEATREEALRSGRGSSAAVPVLPSSFTHAQSDDLGSASGTDAPIADEAVDDADDAEGEPLSGSWYNGSDHATRLERELEELRQRHVAETHALRSKIQELEQVVHRLTPDQSPQRSGPLPTASIQVSDPTRPEWFQAVEGTPQHQSRADDRSCSYESASDSASPSRPERRVSTDSDSLARMSEQDGTMSPAAPRLQAYGRSSVAERRIHAQTDRSPLLVTTFSSYAVISGPPQDPTLLDHNDAETAATRNSSPNRQAKTSRTGNDTNDESDNSWVVGAANKQRVFDDADINSDGRVDEREVQALLERLQGEDPYAADAESRDFTHLRRRYRADSPSSDEDDSLDRNSVDGGHESRSAVPVPAAYTPNFWRKKRVADGQYLAAPRYPLGSDADGDVDSNASTGSPAAWDTDLVEVSAGWADVGSTGYDSDASTEIAAPSDNEEDYGDETPPPSDSDFDRDSPPQPSTDDGESDHAYSGSDGEEGVDDSVLRVVGRKVMENPSVAGAPPDLNAALHVLAVRSLNLGLAQVALDFLDHSYNVSGLGEQLVEAEDEQAKSFVRKLKPILTSTRKRLQRAAEVFNESYVSISEQATTFANAAAILTQPSNVTATISGSDDSEDDETTEREHQGFRSTSVRDADGLTKAAASLDDEAGEETFKSADVNGDGRLDEAEFHGLIAAAVRATNTDSAQSHSPGLRVAKQSPAQRAKVDAKTSSVEKLRAHAALLRRTAESRRRSPPKPRVAIFFDNV